MSKFRQALLVAAAMLAFAGNSLLCRLALRTTEIDAGSFTVIRLASGALMLGLLVRLSGRVLGGSWMSAAALFVYVAAFSFAYVALPAAVGALVLFGTVQVSMLGYAVLQGDRPGGLKLAGIGLAILGLVLLLLPGLAAPSPFHAALMLAAGVAWGVYSIRGRAPGEPTAETSGNFLRAVPFALALALLTARHVDADGAIYAVLSGAVTSGLGYAVWYAGLRGLPSAQAATVQLSVPVLTAFGGVLLLGEPLTPRLLVCSAAILGGIALVIRPEARRPA